MRIVHSLFFLMAAQVLFLSSANAQQLLKTIRDYGLEKPFQFSPDDPWTRSEVYRLQAGYSGLFFNCDGQEDKRCSPYICWKDTCDLSLFPRRSLVGIWVKDWRNTRQRVIDGAGACCGKGCQCAKCKKQGCSENADLQSCQLSVTMPQVEVAFEDADVKAMTAKKSSVALRSTVQRSRAENPESLASERTPLVQNQTKNQQTASSVPPSQQQVTRRYGLISGRTLDVVPPATTSQIQIETKKSRFAEALDLIKKQR